MFSYKLLLFSLFPLFIVRDASAQRLTDIRPNAAILQFAGSIGFFSVGASYDLFKNRKGSLDFTYGYVPEARGGKLHIISTKFNYRPFTIGIKKWAKLYPFNPGAFITYTLDKDLPFKFNRHQYQKGYYWWSPALRPHISFSHELELNTEILWPKSGIKTLRVYLEFNTNDYYIVNYIHSPSSLSVGDLLQAGLGMRISF